MHGDVEQLLVSQQVAGFAPPTDLFGDRRRRQQFGHDNADYQHPNQTPSFI
jgi:hypothetical protein